MSVELSLGSSRTSRFVSRLIGKGRWLAPLLLLAVAGAANAVDTFTVNSLTDDASGVAANCPANAVPTGTCTLRDAIAAANADTNGGTIQFSVSGVIVVTSTLNINNSKAAVTITNQSGTGPIAISGNNSQQVFGVLPGTATIAYLTIENGNGGSTTTGGIYNEGNLTLNDVVLQNNTTAAGLGGGAIYNASAATLTLNYTTFSGNSESITGSTGGAIRNASGATLTVNSSTFANNSAYQGGAIEDDSASALTITNSTFSGNSASYQASAIFSDAGAVVTINDSTFWGNNKYGIVYGDSPSSSGLTINNSLFDTTSECNAGSPATCPTSGSKGNVFAPTNSVSGRPAVLPLGNFGGPAPTIMPMPGSSAICAGVYADVPGAVTIDQRTFPFNSACVDAGAVQTNYITVTTGSDHTANAANCPGSNCAFRDAVAAANAAFNGDIDFASGLSTISLTAEGPTNLYNTVIIGPGPSSLTVTGLGSNVLFGTFGGTVYMYGMTFANGYNNSDGTGGAIYNQTNLTVSNMIFTGNVADGAGGAIYTKQGSLTVLNSSFTNNTAPQGSAIYNNTTNGPLVAEYSTFANNTATTNEGGAIFSAYGAPLSLYNTTLTGNTNTGIIFTGSSALTVENSLLGDSGECIADSPAACPTSGALGNVVTPTNSNSSIPAFTAAGSYSGSNTLYATQSVLPEPGSSAICAGSSTLIPAGITTDQRGFSNENLTYTGYSSSKPCVDAGAVQTNYTAAQFVGSPYAGTVNKPGTTPPVVVSVTENAQNVGGVLVPLTFSGTGTASGLTATTVEGTGATFSSIESTQASGGSPDTLSTSMTVVGTDKLTAGPVNLTITAATNTAPAITSASSTTFFVGSAGSFTVTATGTPAPTFSKTGTLPSGVTLTSAGLLSGTPAAGTAGTYPITITASNGVSPNATQSFTLTVIQSCTTSNPNPNPNPESFSEIGDFNGDCKSDILWRNTSSEQVYQWLMNGTSISNQGSPGSPSSAWVIEGVGDFNGDGKADVLWQNTTTGEVYIWLMNGISISNQGTPGTLSPSSGWSIAGIGDFNGDGMADVIWQNSNTGDVYIWLMNGTTITSQVDMGVIGSGWAIRGVGDFNGDGKADVLWQNGISGEVYIWFMNGTTITSQGSPDTLSPSAGWVVQGVADYNGDGKSDILWRNSNTGDVYIWLMNGTTIANQGDLGDISSSWQISTLVSP